MRSDCKERLGLRRGRWAATQDLGGQEQGLPGWAMEDNFRKYRPTCTSDTLLRIRGQL